MVPTSAKIYKFILKGFSKIDIKNNIQMILSKKACLAIIRVNSLPMVCVAFCDGCASYGSLIFQKAYTIPFWK